MFQSKKNKTSEYQKYLNVYEMFSGDEIKNLKKLSPEIHNLFRDSLSTIGDSNKNSFIKNTLNKEPSKKLIPKKQFYTLILAEIKKYFEQKKDSTMSKIINLLINEIISISKIIQENQVLNEFFDNLRKDKSKTFEDSKKLKQIERVFINSGNDLKNYQSKKTNLIINSSKKVQISKISNKKQSKEKNRNYSNSANKILRNINNISNSPVKNRLNFIQANINKKSKQSAKKLNITNKKINKESNIIQDFSIIDFAKSHSDMLKDIESANFDIFELDKLVGRNNILPLIGYYIFNRLGFEEILNYNKFEKWIKKIDEGYLRSNSYHTNIHSADVTQTCLIYLKMGELDEFCNFTKNSKCGLILSCICHDFKHPGVNNNFLKETKNPLALEYNDASILENMHLAETFKLINSNDTFNIFDKIENNVYKQFRKEMISCVLATDMAFHNNYVNFLKYKIDDIKKEGKNINKNDDYQNYLNLLIHSADISNPTKPFDIYFKWAKLVVNEFYDQGDKEKKLGMNCSCDRNKVTIYQSQLGFINFIEIPFFSLFAEIFPKLKFYNDQLISNKNKLISMEEEDKKKNENLNNKCK